VITPVRLTPHRCTIKRDKNAGSEPAFFISAFLYQFFLYLLFYLQQRQPMLRPGCAKCSDAGRHPVVLPASGPGVPAGRCGTAGRPCAATRLVSVIAELRCGTAIYRKTPAH